ncbi:MAG: ATP:cob(I)alamin adenosyltransferase [Hyphococcus sp.]|nr:MAG: ATP:cob(I)alamin adenosyltransferase [Marinicaulis sp.]
MGDGARVAKDDPRVELIGDIDELNSWIGVVINYVGEGEVSKTLIGVQHDLFDLGGALCFPGAPLLSERHVGRLDEASTALNSDLPPLKEFILPGGSSALAWLHVARTVCRRAERGMVAFMSAGAQGQFAVAYLNRLSDYLFIAARFEAKRSGVKEVLWKKASRISSDDASA